MGSSSGTLHAERTAGDSAAEAGRARISAAVDRLIDSVWSAVTEQMKCQEAVDRGDHRAAQMHARAFRRIVRSTPKLTAKYEQRPATHGTERAVTPAAWIGPVMNTRRPERRSTRAARRHAASTTRSRTSSSSDPEPPHARLTGCLAPAPIGGAR